MRLPQTAYSKSPLKNLLARIDRFSYILLLSALAAAILFCISLLKSKTLSDNTLNYFLLFYTIFITSFELSRVGGAVLFRNHRSKVITYANKAIRRHQTGFVPSVSFVIPCKNEGPAIRKTVEKCFAADYPKEKLEVIVINDGSTDNTAEILDELAQEFDKLTVVHWTENRGKRHGMAEGFFLAKGEIIVQLDSDSYIESKSFKEIIRPFANPEVGAVCAHADPENADTNTLTKMQAAYYFMSFRILKSAESVFMSVFCCSGCSSAYRKSIVLPIMDDWLKESFLGLPVTWGDDRSLTNQVIKLGYKTIYTDRAQAYTICPDSIRQFLRQQTRWKKGWFVNSLFASKFIIKRNPFVAITYFFPLILITLLTPFMAVRALIYYPIAHHALPLYYILGVFLITCIITVFYRIVSPENKYWPYLFVWSAINMIVLSFILFYSLITIQNRKWGTR